jgi:hypothetical protein
MHLTDIEVLGRDVPVDVDEDGTFRVSLNPELQFEADTLDRLTRVVRDSVLAERAEAPFVNDAGTRGVMRGWHAGNRDILVTWEGGEKDRISPHTRVFPTLDDETIEEIRALERTVRAAQNRLAELREPGVAAQDVFVKQLAEDVFDWQRP